MPDVTVEEVVATSPEAAWRLVSDVTRMGEWSPETTSCRWIGGANGPAVGARFRGANRKGWRRWSTTCTVVASDPAEVFSFEVQWGPLPISRWTYQFSPEAGGCRVRETWEDRRPGWMSRFDPTLMGIADRGEHNRATMQATLAQLRRYAEGSAG